MDSKLFLEIRRAIGIIQVYVSVHERAVVKIRQDGVEITSQDGGARIQQHGLQGYELLPNSCKSLRYVAGEGLHFRLALKGNIISEKGELFPQLHPNKEIQSDADSFLCQQFPPGGQVLFSCVTCGYVITNTLM